MIRKDILIRNPSVLDLQNAALLAQVASAFRSKIYIEYGNKKANAKSHMGLLTLNVKPGTALKVIADGEDCLSAMQAVEKHLSR